MATQKTIAIIGALEDAGQKAITRLNGSGYRILLFYKETEQPQAEATPEMEWISCPVEASWEADVVLLAVPVSEHPDIAAVIKNVSTGKPVVDIRNGETDAQALIKLLPGSIVRAADVNAIDLLLKEIF